MSDNTNIVLPLSSSVLRQVKRLKGTIPEELREKTVRTITGERKLSPAISFFTSIKWDKDRVYYIDDNMFEEKILWVLGDIAEPITVDGGEEPLFMIATTSLQYCVIVKVDDLSDNPIVYRVDHDGSSSLGNGQLLSKFLTSLKTVNTKSSGKKQQLLDALNIRNTDDLIKCLQKGASVKAFDKTGFAPLHYAAIGRNTSSVLALLEAGADPNAKIIAKEVVMGPKYRATESWLGYNLLKDDSPLLLSVNKQCGIWRESQCVPEVVQALLEAGADPNHFNCYGHSALSMIAGYKVKREPNAVKILEMLLKAGADPNVRTENARTPLFNAIDERQEVLFDLLVAAKADPHMIAKRYGKLPLSEAVRGGTEWVKKVLAIGADPNFLANSSLKNVKKPTAMHMAILLNKSDCLKLMIDAGGDPNLRTPEGSLLDFARTCEQEDMVKALKDMGAVEE